jgi:hypothetical protein
LKKWYVVHSSDHSTLYYGFYRSVNPRDEKDGAEGQRAIDDLNKIREMHDTDGNRIFSASLPVPINSPDPQANPAWDITKTKGYWSIEIATFSNSADRKERAVDAVRAAREQGVEAYYYHGPTASSVCIGSWPQESALEITPEVQNPNPDAPVVATDRPLSADYSAKLEKNNVQTVAPRVEVQDLTLTQALNKWPEHASNGYVLMQKVIDPVTHEEVTRPQASFLFKIPHPDPLDTMTPTDTAAVAPPPAQDDTHTIKPGVGQLRSLGD